MKIDREDDTVRVELVDSIAFTNAHKIRNDILKYIDKDAKTLVLNISKVDFMDSSGIGILISLLKKMKSKGGRLIIEHPKLGVQKLFEMTKLDEIIEVRKSPEPTTGSWDDFDD